MKRILSGNEAIALGAYHAGVKVACAYPGTPSTEILENLAQFEGVYAEWSTNEKVAMEVALGASYGGVRAMASMKMVGLNVAADPFLGASVTGVNGGLVVVSADDPGMHSSQNEQDNRHYARLAKLPMLEPGDSQEAYDLMARAFAMSEEFDTPVPVRTTTRTSHCQSVVEVPEGVSPSPARPRFKRDPYKYVMVPAYARPRHQVMEERLIKLARYSESFPLNRMELNGPSREGLGIISAGAAYQYAKEVFPEASFLKLVMTYPLPADLVRRFASQVKRLLVIEELDPFLEEGVRLLGLEVEGKRYFSITGELSTEVVEQGAIKAGLRTGVPRSEEPKEEVKLPLRPPVLCPGCPHTATAFALRRLGLFSTALPAQGTVGGLPALARREGLIATSDIGCYTLSVYPPLLALDTCACMGASIGQAHGLDKAGVVNRVVAVIGDSTFVHSGITGLVNMVYNQGKSTVIILDNGTTAMTGGQGHPGTGINARGQKAVAVDLVALARGIGVRDVNLVDAFDLAAIEATIRRCVETQEPSVIVVRGPCPLHSGAAGKALKVETEKCDDCGACIRLGCPAIARQDGRAQIDHILCIGEGCQVCRQVCPKQAILPNDGKQAS